MGSAAELIYEADEDLTWHIAGQTFGLIFAQACVLVAERPELAIPPSPPPDPTKTPSPNMLDAKDCVKRVLGCLDDADSEDLRSTVGRTSSLGDDSRSTALDVDAAESECDMDAIRALARDALGRGAESGSLMEMLQTAIVPYETDKRGLEALTTEESAGQVENLEEVRSLAKDAIVKGLLDGSLNNALAETLEPSSLVPHPPEGTRIVKSCPRPGTRPRAAETNFEEVLQKISAADRRVGHLHVQICEKERQIRQKDERCKAMTDTIQHVQTSLEHLGVDLQWHQEQILAAEDRWNRINEDRRAIAFKLDEMRMAKDTTPGTKAPMTAQSWASTATGCALAGSANSAMTPGWGTERSAIVDKQCAA
jgi:hypothetical protein|mmetsp:Transcript_57272/g.91065  ORF Transcript_57272/g.91065 Transcript_57272/m.91065 type:complete len:367 (-) Transcript_57272:216-1316(-)